VLWGFKAKTQHQLSLGAENKPVLIQRLTPAQMKEKRDKGLCFKCDNKWGPGHRCGGPRIFLIEEVEEEKNCVPEDLIDLGEP